MNHWETMKYDRTTPKRRLTIQFAADAERLWHGPASADIRKESPTHPAGQP